MRFSKCKLSYFSTKPYGVTTHWNRLNEGHIIGIGWEMRKLSWKQFCSLFLNCSPAGSSLRCLASVHIFKRNLLWNHWPNSNQTTYYMRSITGHWTGVTNYCSMNFARVIPLAVGPVFPIWLYFGRRLTKGPLGHRNWVFSDVIWKCSLCSNC